MKYYKLLDNQPTRVFLHPSSVNFHQGDYRSPFLVYHTIVRTSKVRHCVLPRVASCGLVLPRVASCCVP